MSSNNPGEFVEWQLVFQKKSVLEKSISFLLRWLFGKKKDVLPKPFPEAGYHKLHIPKMTRLAGPDGIILEGCYIPKAGKRIRDIYVKMGRKKIFGEWGLSRFGSPSTICTGERIFNCGYKVCLPACGKDTVLAFYAVMQDGTEQKIWVRKLKVKRVPGKIIRQKKEQIRQILSEAWPAGESRRGKRVLLVTHMMNLTGAPILLWHLASGLKKEGYDVAALSFENAGELKQEFTKIGVPVLDEPWLADPDSHLAELFDEAGSVLANTVQSVGAVRAFEKRGIPVIWWIQDGNCGLESLRTLSFTEEAFRQAAAVVFPSRTTAAIYRSLLKEPPLIIPNGVSDPFIACPEEDTGWEDKRLTWKNRKTDKVTFLQLGMVCERKGQDLTIEAFRLLPEQTSARTWLYLMGEIGNTSYYRSCRESTKAMPMIEWLNGDYQTGALAIMAEADVLIVASRDEALPVVIQEAMAMGKVIITSCAGGVAEYLEDGKNALLIPTDDPVALMENIRICVEQPDRVRQLGLEARKSYENVHRASQMVDAFTGVIEAISSGPA